MLIDTVDQLDRVIGAIERSAALIAGVNFRVVHIFIFNQDGMLLIQQIPDGKRYGGLWGSSVAGYVRSGETYQQAAERRLFEELGIRTRVKLVGKTSMKENNADKFIALFTAEFSGWPEANSDEVATVEWIRIELVDHLIESGVRRFTPTFSHLVQFLRECEVKDS